MAGAGAVSPMEQTDEPARPYAGTMLTTLIVVLVVLWLLGFSMSVGGGLIHLLLVIAVIVVVIRLIQGRSPIS